MLSQAHKRIHFAFYLLCLFCIIPCDWNGKKMRLTPTKSRVRNVLNCLLTYAVVFAFIVFPIMFWVDLYYGRVGVGPACIMGLYIGAGVMVSLLAAMSRWYVHDCKFTVNNVMILEDIYKKMKLDKKILEDQQTKHKQLVLIGSNTMEALVIFYTISLPFLFAEEFDPFRRYIYNVVLFFLPVLEDSFFFTSFMVGLYAGAVRVCLSYVVFAVYMMAMFVQFHYYWKSVLYESCSKQSLTDFPSDHLQKIFNTTYVFGKIFVDSEFTQLFLPGLLVTVFVSCVMALVATVKLVGILNLFNYLILPTAAVAYILAARILWVSVADAQELANEVLRQWQNKLPRTHEEVGFVKHATCRRSLVGVVGPYCAMSRTSFAEFCEQMLDKVITLLLY